MHKYINADNPQYEGPPIIKGAVVGNELYEETDIFSVTYGRAPRHDDIFYVAGLQERIILIPGIGFPKSRAYPLYTRFEYDEKHDEPLKILMFDTTIQGIHMPNEERLGSFAVALWSATNDKCGFVSDSMKVMLRYGYDLEKTIIQKHSL
jgi:hypothetical protein